MRVNTCSSECVNACRLVDAVVAFCRQSNVWSSVRESTFTCEYPRLKGRAPSQWLRSELQYLGRCSGCQEFLVDSFRLLIDLFVWRVFEVLDSNPKANVLRGEFGFEERLQHLKSSAIRAEEVELS